MAGYCRTGAVAVLTAIRARRRKKRDH